MVFSNGFDGDGCRMTLKLFEKTLQEECKKAYKTLRDGSRQKKLKEKKVNSLRDVMFLGRDNPLTLYQSCIITFGNVLEKATLNYANLNGKKIYRNKNFLSARIDIVFKIGKKVYNLESKGNIELDAGKTKKALETLKRKHKMVFHGLDCQNEGLQVISKFVVWTKATAEDAAMVAKRPITKEHLMGFKNFFELFGVEVSEKDFFKMLQGVWSNEIERYFPKN